MEPEKISSIISTVNMAIFVLGILLMFFRGPVDINGQFVRKILGFSTVLLGVILFFILAPMFSVINLVYHKRNQQKISERKRKIASFISKTVLWVSVVIFVITSIVAYFFSVF